MKNESIVLFGRNKKGKINSLKISFGEIQRKSSKQLSTETLLEVKEILNYKLFLDDIKNKRSLIPDEIEKEFIQSFKKSYFMNDFYRIVFDEEKDFIKGLLKNRPPEDSDF